jgi:hypothetical protein
VLVSQVLTSSSKKSRLQNIESRLGKLQSLCQTAGILPTEATRPRETLSLVQLGERAPQYCVNSIPMSGKSQSDFAAHHQYRHQGDPDMHSTTSSGCLPSLESPELSVGAHMIQPLPVQGILPKGALTAPENGSALQSKDTGYGMTLNNPTHVNEVFPGTHNAQTTLLSRENFSGICTSSTMDIVGAGMSLLDGHSTALAPFLDSDNSASVSSPTDHFQTLAMIFADTSETQLLAELHDMPPPSFLEALPPKDATYSALNNFFRHFDRLVPLYDEATTFNLVELFFDPLSCPAPEVAAYIYSVIAVSFTCNENSTSPASEAGEVTAWAFFSHAARYVPQIMASSPKLLSTQALLGMVSSKRQVNDASLMVYIVSVPDAT